MLVYIYVVYILKMSGTLYRMIKTCHQDMDQDEHRIYQMFALSFHEHGKDHSLFIDNKNGVYHLKQFPFLSFTLREKNELFYKLKNKYFGEKCTYTFEPTSARNIHKTYRDGSKSFTAVVIHIFTFAILCFLFVTDSFHRFQNKLPIQTMNPKQVTVEDIERQTIQNLDTALNNPETFTPQGNKKYHDNLSEVLCNNNNMVVTAGKMEKEDVPCYTHLFKILEKKKMEPTEKKVLIEFKNYLYDSGENNIDKYMEDKFKDENDNSISSGSSNNKNQGSDETSAVALRQRQQKLGDTASTLLTYILGSNTKNKVSDDNGDKKEYWRKHLKKLKHKIKNGDIVFTNNDISDSIDGKTVSNMVWIDNFFFPNQSRINHDMVINRWLFALAVPVPILCNLISLFIFKNKVSKKNSLAELATTTPAITLLINAITSFAKNTVISNQYYLKSWLLYYVSHCLVNYVFSSTFIINKPAYRYYKGSYIITYTNDGREFLELVNDDFNIDDLIIEDQNKTIRTRFLPGDIISISKISSKTIGKKNKWIVLALAGYNQEKRILINHYDFFEKREGPDLDDIIYISIDECYSYLPAGVTDYSERSIYYKGDVIYGLNVKPTQNTIKEMVSDLSIIFLFCNEYYYIQRNKKEDELIRLRQPNDVQTIGEGDNVDFSFNFDNYCYRVFMYDNKNKEFVYKDIKPIGNYQYPQYTWEMETERYRMDHQADI